MSSTDNYTLGKGVVSFNQEDGSGSYLGELDLGNCPEFTFNITLEQLEHFSSRGGIRAKDMSVISQISPAVAFTLDEITAENLALLTLADVSEVVQTTDSVAGEQPGPAFKGRMLALEFRAVDVETIVVTDAADGALVEGTDWEVDLTLKDDVIGRIRIMDTFTAAEGNMVKVSYDYDDLTYTKLSAISQTSIKGFLRFVSDNPIGNQQELHVHRIDLTPSGDTAMIGDDWSTLAFAGEILKDSENNPTSPYFDILMS